MYEATTNFHTKAAFEAAHVQRGQMLRRLVKALFGLMPKVRNFPLGGTALTGLPR